MLGDDNVVFKKYLPYYDAFSKSGLNGWNSTQSNLYMTANSDGTGDGVHPNVEGYKRYYVPQLIELFKSLVLSDGAQNEEVEPIINQIPISIDVDGSIFNGKGWLENTRVNSSGVATNDNATGYNLTGYIPITQADKLYIASGVWNHEPTASTYDSLACFDSSFSKIGVFYPHNSQTGELGAGFIYNQDGSYVFDLSTHNQLSSVAYLRITGDGINENALVTVNQPI